MCSAERRTADAASRFGLPGLPRSTWQVGWFRHALVIGYDAPGI